MGRKHFIVRKILENVPPNQFIPRPYYLDLLDAVAERNSIICKDKDITLQFVIQSLYRDIASKNPKKCMLVIINDSTLIDDSAKIFQYTTDDNVFIADITSTSVPENVDAVFMSAETAAKLCAGVAPAFSILERVSFLVLDDCDLALKSDHPYHTLFPAVKCELTEEEINTVWDRPAEFYSFVTPYRILGLTFKILPDGCSDHFLAKRYICSLEHRLNCRLETTSELYNVLSFGAQPEELEIYTQAPSDNGSDQHPICRTLLRLLQEAHDFLSDLDFTDTEANVSTGGERIINVPYYCLRAVAQCESITRELGVYCGAIIARVFLRHLYRLERARAATLECKNQLEHGEDLLTRILRYTATQLSMVARLFQVVSENCTTKEEVRTLASPRVCQLIDHLRTVKPTGTYRIEAVRQTEGFSEVEDSDNVDNSDDDSDTGRRSSTRSTSVRSRGGRRGSRKRSECFVAPHGLEDDDGSSQQQSDSDDGSFSSTFSPSNTDSDDESASNAGRGSEVEDEMGSESGAESDVTDVSMCLSTGLHRKSKSKSNKRSNKTRNNSLMNRCQRREKIVYRIVAYQPEGVPVVPPLCGLVLVGGCQFSAYALPRFLEDFCNWDSDIAFVRPVASNITLDKSKSTDLSTANTQEETVANFRCGGEVNLLVTTQSGLAAASTLPKCNLVASFHPSNSIETYLLAKSRLRLVSIKTTKARLWHFLEPSKISMRNQFQEIERMLIQRCSRSGLSLNEHDVDLKFVDEAFDFLPKVRSAIASAYFCTTKEEVRTLASPRVCQLIDHLRTVKPTGTYRIEAVRQTEGFSEVEDSDNVDNSDDDSDTGRRSSTRSTSVRSRGGRRGSRKRSECFVAPHGLEDDDGSSQQQSDSDDGSFSSTFSPSNTDSDDESASNAGRGSEVEDEMGSESGAESDVTDVSMCLSTGLHRKSKSKSNKRSNKTRNNSLMNRCQRREKIVYRIVAYQPEGVPVVPPLCGLVLVGGCQFSAYALPRFLEDFCNWDSDIAFVRPVASNITLDKSKSTDLSTANTQEETVANFRCGGEVNLLVTTQSGLAAASTLPKCNLVASFHPSNSIETYLLAKSRLRLVSIKTTKARLWHFLEPSKISMRNQFQEIERMLIQRCSRSGLSLNEHDVDLKFVDEAFDFLPKRNASRAIDVINHYCARLPCNFMTRLAPRWNLISRPLVDVKSELGDSGKILTCPDTDHKDPKVAYRCALQMPSNSPINQVVWGDWSVCKKMAKYSASVRVGHLLLEAREISNSGRAILRHSSIIGPSRIIRESRCRSPVKTKSSYLIKTPDAFVRCLPKEDLNSTTSQNYLYLIDVRHLDSVLTHLQQQRKHKGTSSASLLFYPESENRIFAFLTSKRLPYVPDFSIFTRSGEETVSIYEANSCPCLNINQLNRLSNFHRILFKSVLRVEKDTLMTFCLPEAQCQILIIPVKLDSQEIDWDLVDLCLSTFDPAVGDCRMPIRRRPTPPFRISEEPFPLTQLLSTPDSSQTVFDFVPEDFANAVLTPTYRLVDFPPRYYVVTIRNDLSPASRFPSPQFSNFADYYRSKYGLHLSGSAKDQPLLDAAYAPLRLASLLVPRCLAAAAAAAQRKAANSGGGGKKENTNSSRGAPRHVQLLVPEFCYRHALPATVWQKAVCLPSILYRLHHLLLAEELRSEIARETGMGIVDPPSRACFPALRCHALPKLASLSRSNSPANVREESTVHEQDNLEVVKLTLNRPSKGDTHKTGHDFDTLLADFSGDSDKELDDSNIDEIEEEIDAESVDSFEENVGKLTFFPPQDDDTDLENRILYRPGPAMILQSLTRLAAGDFINMERLETIGDSFLKFAVTTYLYLKYPDAQEGSLSLFRSHVVENSNLYRFGCGKKLPGRIVGVAFEPQENWLPPCYVCNSDNSSADDSLQMVQTHQFLSNKSIADCVEALVGCYLTERGERSALKLLQWFGVECLPPSSEMQPTGAPWKMPDERGLTEAEKIEIDRIYHVSRYDKLENTIGYRFKNRRLLIEALTHSTCRDLHSNPSVNNTPSSVFFGNGGYERLEFLGDAVLDYTVTRVLFESTDGETVRELSPGGLTDLRSALVNNAVFGALAVTHCGLHAYLRGTAPYLTEGTSAFLRHIRNVSRGSLNSKRLLTPDSNTVARLNDAENQADSGAVRPSNEMEAEVPKALGDVFESLAGAVFLDSGLCLNTLWRIFFPLLRERIERYSTCVAKSPVRRLLEQYPERVKFEKPMVRPDGKIRLVVRVVGIGRYVGIGRTYRLAKSAAADLAYRRAKEAANLNSR
nr:dicer 1 [Hymenolepis microstoma]